MCGASWRLCGSTRDHSTRSARAALAALRSQTWNLPPDQQMRDVGVYYTCWAVLRRHMPEQLHCSATCMTKGVPASDTICVVTV